MEQTINVRGRLVNLAHPLVMGILNCTPDSFYAESRKQSEVDIVGRAHQIVAEGGAIIDIGAFSTRPGGSEVDADEEATRLQSAVRLVRRELPDAIISVDTFRPLIARAAIEDWGADMINDVSEGRQENFVGTATPEEGSMFETVARLQVPYILMSLKPTIESMLKAWAGEVQQLHELGVKDIILDPGFGFGKTLDENYALMSEMEKLNVMELPLLVGVSRKSMVWKLLEGTPQTALNGTTVLHTLALQKGAGILRVHDVREAVEAVRIFEKTQMRNNS